MASTRSPIVVTGAYGQLGRAIARIVPEGSFLSRAELDVTDPGAVIGAFRQLRPRLAIHAAAWTRVDAAEADPDGARLVNVSGTESVATAAAEVGALLVYPSTDYVFPGRQTPPYREEDPTEPLSVYGATKLAGEEAVRRYERHLIVRTSWVFGEGRNFVAAILSAARAGDGIDVVCDQIGLPTYAKDLAAGIMALVEREARGTFHLAGGGEAASWAALAEAALESAARVGLLSRCPRVRPVTSSEYAATRGGPVAPRPWFSTLDCSRAAELGVRLRPWTLGLDDYVGTLASTAVGDGAAR